MIYIWLFAAKGVEVLHTCIVWLDQGRQASNWSMLAGDMHNLSAHNNVNVCLCAHCSSMVNGTVAMGLFVHYVNTQTENTHNSCVYTCRYKYMYTCT